MFAGDLVENGNVPFFGDGYPLDWVATAQAVAERVTGVIVPGHGDQAGRTFAPPRRPRSHGSSRSPARSTPGR